MLLLSCRQLRKSYGSKQVFTDVSFDLHEGDKAGLIGANGIGKTTILKIIAGGLEPDSGEVSFPQKQSRVAYLPQVTLYAPYDRPLSDLISNGKAELSKIREALKRFGLSGLDPAQPACAMSGGEKTRLALAQMWLSEADCLLLDEPTNYLDQSGLSWLEDYLVTFKGTVLVVSHDRYFLDQVVTRIIELSAEGARCYPGNYTAFKEARKREIESQTRAYIKQKKQVEELKQAISRQCEWSNQAHRTAGKQSEIRSARSFYRSKAKKMAKRAKSTIKRLERLQTGSVTRPRIPPSIRLDFKASGTSGKCLVQATDLGKSFDHPLFKTVQFQIMRGDKVGLTGPNGVGKTTLLRLIGRQLEPTEGEIWISPSAKIAHFDQELGDLSPDKTVLEEITGSGIESSLARSFLARFLFTGEAVFQTVGDLSQGEMARLTLLKMLLSPANLLLLDEPTSHLDLSARERVEEALRDYNGACVLVSHDRYLLSHVCNKIMNFRNGRIYEYSQEEYWEGPSQKPNRDNYEERLVLKNRLSLLSAELASLDQEDPEYARAVEEFLRISRQLKRGK